jgi:hypothetical protein
VADRLASDFGKERVLYDRYHEAEFARVDLGHPSDFMSSRALQPSASLLRCDHVTQLRESPRRELVGDSFFFATPQER